MVMSKYDPGYFSRAALAQLADIAIAGTMMPAKMGIHKVAFGSLPLLSAGHRHNDATRQLASRSGYSALESSRRYYIPFEKMDG